MKIEYSDLSKDGLIIYPGVYAAATGFGSHADAVLEFLDSDRNFPEIVGLVPNLSEFATGGDYNVGAFEIKGQDSGTICVPGNLAHLLPTTQLIIDDFYRHAGPSVADQCQISLQFFRTSYERNQHLLFDRIHRHATEGKMVIYVVTAIDAGDRGDHEALGTEFYAPQVMGKRISRAQRAASPSDFMQQFASRGIVAAPGGAIIRFSENTLHAAPDLTHGLIANASGWRQLSDETVRRSLLNIIASYKLRDGTVYGRTRPPNDHRPSPVDRIEERRDEYFAAAERALAQRDAIAPWAAEGRASSNAPARRRLKDSG